MENRQVATKYTSVDFTGRIRYPTIHGWRRVMNVFQIKDTGNGNIGTIIIKRVKQTFKHSTPFSVN